MRAEKVMYAVLNPEARLHNNIKRDEKLDASKRTNKQ